MGGRNVTRTVSQKNPNLVILCSGSKERKRLRVESCDHSRRERLLETNALKTVAVSLGVKSRDPRKTGL